MGLPACRRPGGEAQVTRPLTSHARPTIFGKTNEWRDATEADAGGDGPTLQGVRGPGAPAAAQAAGRGPGGLRLPPARGPGPAAADGVEAPGEPSGAGPGRRAGRTGSGCTTGGPRRRACRGPCSTASTPPPTARPSSTRTGGGWRRSWDVAAIREAAGGSTKERIDHLPSVNITAIK